MASDEELKAAAHALNEAVATGEIIICYTRCYPCQFGCHFEPAEPHTWGDKDDFEHAEATGQPEPGTCACWCAKEGGGDV